MVFAASAGVKHGDSQRGIPDPLSPHAAQQGGRCSQSLVTMAGRAGRADRRYRTAGQNRAAVRKALGRLPAGNSR